MQELQSIIPFIAPVLIVQLILMVTALVACAKAERMNGPKWLWVLIILFVGIIGPVLFFVIGRRND
ncbi:Negative regulatory protein YxlE [compost metagenome]